YYFFFFSSRRRHTRSKRDWSSDVCSSDLIDQLIGKSENILNDYQTKYDAYSEYEADINERDTFMAFNSSYNNAKNDLLAQIVKYKNFEGDKVDEIESWAKDNDITLVINKVERDESIDTILDELPSTS